MLKGAVLALMLASTLPLSAADRLVEGDPSSGVRVLIYEDLQCSDCAAFRLMLDQQLLPKYGARVAFERRDFPLAKHAWARKAAIAARFFQKRGSALALEYRRQTMSAQSETTAENFDQRLADFARARGLDPKAAVAALDNPGYAAAVEKDFQDGVARGVAKTPTAFVNGEPFIETFTFEEISRAIEAALAQ